MRQIFVVFETDAWHSTQNRTEAGVFTSKHAAVNAIVKNHRIELDEFFDEDEIEKTSKRVLEAEVRRRLRKELEILSNMTNKQRKTMIERWVTDINPKAILRAADARCGARYAVYVVETSGDFGLMMELISCKDKIMLHTF